MKRWVPQRSFPRHCADLGSTRHSLAHRSLPTTESHHLNTRSSGQPAPGFGGFSPAGTELRRKPKVFITDWCCNTVCKEPLFIQNLPPASFVAFPLVHSVDVVTMTSHTSCSVLESTLFPAEELKPSELFPNYWMDTALHLWSSLLPFSLPLLARLPLNQMESWSCIQCYSHGLTKIHKILLFNPILVPLRALLLYLTLI